jgi:hypothetical protein
MHYPTLWRVERQADGMLADVDALAEGLRLHVVHSPLLTVAMQIGEQQRCYLLLEGCAGCANDHCRVGCTAALLRRLIDSKDFGLTLRAVAPPQGLARRPYTRGAFAWPRPEAEPLDGALLGAWEDARLALYWRRYGSTICGSALLLAGATGPVPREVLQAHGWRACAAPPLLLRRWKEPALPPALPFGAPWPWPLFLLLPAPAVSEGDATSNDRAHSIGG